MAHPWSNRGLQQKKKKIAASDLKKKKILNVGPLFVVRVNFLQSVKYKLLRIHSSSDKYIRAIIG